MIVGAADFLSIGYPADAIGIFVMPVKAQLIINPQKYENTAGHAYG